MGRSGEGWVKRCRVKLPSLGTRRRGTLIHAIEKKLREREREREREKPLRRELGPPNLLNISLCGIASS